MTGSPARPSVQEVADAFVHAIVWGEHTVIWDLLSPIGRETALGVAGANGLDRVVAGRIAAGLADPSEFDDFLAQLLGGLRRDLRSVDIDQVSVAAIDQAPAGTAVATLTVPSALPGSPGWAAGELELSATEDGEWMVDRLRPRVAGR